MGDIFAKRGAFFFSSLCSCLCFVLFEDARLVYLPNSVCVIFQCYVSDEVLSSYYWNDNSSFPESKGREEGEGGGQLPLTTLFSVLPPYLPSFSQHMDAGVPRDVFQMPELGENIDKKKTHRSSYSCSLPVTHTPWLGLLYCSLFCSRNPSSAQKTFRIQLWFLKSWEKIWEEQHKMVVLRSCKIVWKHLLGALDRQQVTETWLFQKGMLNSLGESDSVSDSQHSKNIFHRCSPSFQVLQRNRTPIMFEFTWTVTLLFIDLGQ